jgi:hypothetical protein
MFLIRNTSKPFLHAFPFICLQEEIAALNLAKYRKAQTDLEDAEERSEVTEQALTKVRGRRAGSIARLAAE